MLASNDVHYRIIIHLPKRRILNFGYIYVVFLGDRCKTVFCFHCESELTKLYCECKEFQQEILEYNGRIMAKMLLLVMLSGAALWIWAHHLSHVDDVYFWILYMIDWCLLFILVLKRWNTSMKQWRN